MAVSRKQMDAIVDDYMRYLETKDLDAISNMYALDGRCEDPVGTKAHEGRAAIREFYKKACSMDIIAKRTAPARAAANEIAFPFTIKITSGEAPVQIDIIDVFVFNDAGEVSSMRAFWGPEDCTPL